MDRTKLDAWADRLLDTGKRNNLIHFRDTKASTAEILIPGADDLFEKIDGNASFEIFDPKIEEPDEESGEDDREGEPEKDEGKGAKGKEAWLSLYAPRIRRQNQLLVWNTAPNPITAIRGIEKRAKEFIEETGVNVAYLAFGFIHWRESEASHEVYQAPILLVPVQLERDSAISPYMLHTTGDEVIVNPTFAYKMEQEYGVKLPEYGEGSLTAYLDEVRKIAAKLKWDVSDECKLGIFSFLKINMYQDLKDNAEEILKNRNVRALLGEPMEDVENDGAAEPSFSEDSAFNPLIELHTVVDADSSQIEAIEMAKSGQSFVLQGPPGTGKSQTITNIIAECLGDGKKVLFVSEKLAALNVVYEKLRQAELAEFCLELHSHKANKKKVIDDLCQTLRTRKSVLSDRAESEITAKERAQKQLDAYAEELHQPQPVIGKSLYQLFEMAAPVRNEPDVDYTIPRISERASAYLRDTENLLAQYAEFVPSIGYDYRKNPWFGFLGQDTSRQTRADLSRDFSLVAEAAEGLRQIAEEADSRYGILIRNIGAARVWRYAFGLLSEGDILTPSLLKRESFEVVWPQIQALKAKSGEILAAKNALEQVFDGDVYKLPGAEYHKKLTRQFDRAVSRLFSAEYKSILSALKLCRKDGGKLRYEDAVEWTGILSDYQRLTEEYAAAEEPVAGLLGPLYKGFGTDWDRADKQLSDLRMLLSHGVSFGKLSGCSDEVYRAEKPVLARFEDRLANVLSGKVDAAERLKALFEPAVFDVLKADFDALLTKCGGCVSTLDQLDNWHQFSLLLSRMKDADLSLFVDQAIEGNVEADHICGAFRKQYIDQWIDAVLSSSPVLAKFSRISQDRAVRLFSEKDREQFGINKAKIRARLSADRPSLDMTAPGSALSILLREGEQKRKQKSIRKLLSETGELVQRIKPCFLMSPLSVSTFLEAGTVHFDTVVFDEASQIFPWDAIGAIWRAEQLIVVGDSRQMPPSNFFNNVIESEEEDEEAGDVTDFESILDLCSTSMKQLRLRWHYRSRYEQLITFSNKNFYDGELITFPSSTVDRAGIGIDYHHVDGLFDRRSHTNRKEAEYIVDLIYRNIDQYPDRSLGVVAFSVAQQDLIDKLLMKKRQETPEKEFFFKRDAEEPFFIKNLETVQGDERDTIIFSVAYGMDAQGRLLHNFGPLNRVGGERRLNVAVTRAKCNVQLVSSMRYTDIDLKKSGAEGVRLLREYLDLAENGEVALERSVSVHPYESFDSEFEEEVADFLKSKGFTVDTQVGCSSFRIDLALKRENSSDYVLAIECDGASYHSSRNARDRDRLRQEILERMGWKFYRIWSTDWYKNKAVEQQRLWEAAANAVRNTAADNPMVKSDLPVSEDSFEVEAEEEHFEFPSYRTAEIEALLYSTRDYRELVSKILETEAPLSEEVLLKRTVAWFCREKVTSTVKQEYDRQMLGCERFGIERRGGFLYRKDMKEIRFRKLGDLKREIRQIAPEELADGMLEILKHNISAEKDSLFRTLALQCGVSRVTAPMTICFEKALACLDEKVDITDGQITIRDDL